MVSGSQLVSYAIVSAVLIAIPGPSVLFAVGRALSRGRQLALATVVGNAFGVYVVAVLVSVGLGTVVARSDMLFQIVKYAGAAYLVYLGVQAIRHRRSLAAALDADQPASPGGTLRAARAGFIVGLANPKALILFGAVLPQFVDRAAGHVPAQMLILALVSLVTALASDSAWVVAASAFRRWFTRSRRRLELVGGTGGLMIIAVGISVAATGRKD
jgi:threonine/homoserine/homoserine lactone efflux protein